MLKSYLFVFLVSMVPIIELRGAIPIGLGMGLPALPTYLVCVLGNMLPVPIIYLFARRFLIWGCNKPLIGGICKFFIVKGEKGGRKLEQKAGRGLTLALLLFVGIPLPGTGAWTGTLAASILDMKFKDVLIACMGGVLLAGIIMGLASAGLLGALSSLFAVG
ncbi:MAG: COG2426 family protein [Faecalibacterium sp.]